MRNVQAKPSILMVLVSTGFYSASGGSASESIPSKFLSNFWLGPSMTTFTTEDRKNYDTAQAKFGDLIISLHDLVRVIEDSQIAFKVRQIANELAIAGNEYESYKRLIEQAKAGQISLDFKWNKTLIEHEEL